MDEKVQQALDLALECGQIDGDHHKTWVIDQMVRILAGDRYDEIITSWRAGVDGPNTYTWNCGIAP